MLKAIVLLFALLLPSLVLGQEEPNAAAVEILSLKLGSHVTSDFSVPVPKTIFKPTDTIHLAVATRATKPRPGTIGVLWTYGQGERLQAVHDESQEVVFSGDGVTVFEISKPDDWPAGQYQAEVFLNGQSYSKIGFTVR